MFFLSLLLAFPSLGFSKSPTDRKAEARAAYERGVELRRSLAAQPEAARRKVAYEKLVRTFQSVYRLDPISSKAPAALAAQAEIYQEMGKVFSTPRYFDESARTYRFLISEYPSSPFSRDALYALGELYRTDLEDREEARKAFQEFVESYPKSPLAPDARKKLNELLKPQQERAAAPPDEKPAGLEKESGALPEVVAVRRWVGPNYSRIVIGLDGEAKFDTSRLRNPDRIVLDLLNTRVSPVLASSTFPVEDGYLRQIRVAQYRPNVTRAVLDVEKIEDYSIFTLPNPFRLVIDIHGAPAQAAEKSPAPVLKAAETTRTPTGSPAPSTPTPTAGKTEAQSAPKEPAPQAEKSGGNSAEKSDKSATNNATKETASLRTPALPSSTKSAPSRSRDAAIRVRPAAPTESGDRTLTRALGLKIGRVVIDPGHGGHDTGTIGPTGLREKDIVLDVALRLKKLFEQKSGSSVVLTRSDDTFVPLEERTAIANEKAADLFISVHANASRDPEARGVETYYLNFTSSAEALEVAARENATSQESVHELQNLIKRIALTEKVRESQEFARIVQRDVHNTLAKAGTTQRDRGLKKAPFVVLIGANMPSVLVEISFLSNPRDERLLKRASYRQKIARALFQGVTRYMNTLGAIQVAERARHPAAPLAPGRARQPVQDSGRDF